MAYARPVDLEGFIPLLSKPDPRSRQLIGDDLLSFLADDNNSLACEDMGLFVDTLMPWISGGNFKVSQNGLEILSSLIKRMGSDFGTYTPSVLPLVIDRLGDSKEGVRLAARTVLGTMWSNGSLQAQQLVTKISAAFQHKNANMREEALHFLADAINDQDGQDLQFKKLTPLVSRLLSDPNVSVRDQASATLVEMYRHAGDRLRLDLRTQQLPANKLTALEQKFDEVQAAGLLLPSATTRTALSAANSTDEIDNIALNKAVKPVKRTLSIPQKKQIESVSSSNGFESRRATTAVMSSGAQSLGSLHSLNSAQMRPPKNPSVDPGAVTVDVFEQQFLKVPPVALYSARDLDDICRLAMSVVGDKMADWEKRIDALKKIRALLMTNAHSLYPTEFTAQLKEMSVPFLVVIKELRSQVVREACITIAYMAKVLKNKLDQFCLYIINELINLIPNSAKIISSSGTLTIRFVVKYVHSPRFIPIITQSMITSKAKEIRSTLSDILCVILETWSTAPLEKQQTAIKEAIKKGCSDADMTARSHCRRAFWLFKKHFPAVAEALFLTIDGPAQKMLTAEKDGNSIGTGIGSRHGSTDSLHQASAYSVSSIRPATERRMVSSRTQSSSVTASAENLTSCEPAPQPPTAANLVRTGSLRRPPGSPLRRLSQDRNTNIPVPLRGYGYQSVGARSVSAVDTGAAARAKARLYSQQVSSMARNNRPVAGYTASLPRSKKNTVVPQFSNPRSPESNAATRSRSRVSQSQPSSRSNSPSSRLPTPSSIISTRPSRRSSNSRIPRSLAGSRETSPIRTTATKAGLTRTGLIGSANRRLSSERPPAARVPLTTQRLLAQSRGAENCLSPDDSNGTDISGEMARLRLGRDMDNESEGSSICSERSYDSYRIRTMDSASLSGSQNRLCGRNDGPVEITMTIPEMISKCASTAWVERKDGLTQLMECFYQGQYLSQHELHQITDIFGRLFHDTHTKVYGIFLDAVCELIVAHSSQLDQWLYPLLTRLLMKLGSDLLGSVQVKVMKVLTIIQEYFPSEQQMYCVFRYLGDPNYKPNTKTRLATLNFATQVVTSYWQPPPAPITSIIPNYTHTGARALNQVVNMAIDGRQSELKVAARRMLAALFNCDAPNMTLMLGELPKEVEHSAMAIIHSYIRRTSSSGSPGLTSSPTTSEDVYRSLKRTTAEIQSFTHGVDSEGDISGIHDISNNRHNGINGHHSLDISDHKTMSADSSEAGSTKNSSPTPQNLQNFYSRGLTSEDHERTKTKVHEFDADGFVITREGIHEQQVLETFIALINSTEDEAAVINSMVSLYEVIKHGNCQKPLAEFRNLMRVLIKLLDRPEERIVAGCIRILIQMFKRDELKKVWLSFFDLIMIKFAEKFGIQKKEVTRILENGLPYLATALPIEMSIPFIMPIMKASECQCKLFALKLTTEIARAHPTLITDEHLELLMSGVSALAEHEHSSMRKAAIFCMVQLQIAVGEARMKPYHQQLSTSKIRLLQVYLNKERGENSSLIKRHGETKV